MVSCVRRSQNVADLRLEAMVAGANTVPRAVVPEQPTRTGTGRGWCSRAPSLAHTSLLGGEGQGAANAPSVPGRRRPFVQQLMKVQGCRDQAGRR